MSSWTPMPQPPFPIALTQLLTDGRVVGFAVSTTPGQSASNRVCVLTPDANGSYAKGTWSTASSMISPRLFFASHTLSDGRLYVSGGEYPSFGDDAETYDPVGNAWTSQGQVGLREGDSPSCILPDGRVYISDINNHQDRIFDPASNTFSNAPPCSVAPPDEASYILTQNDLVLAAGLQIRGTSIPGAIYNPGSNSWSATGLIPNDPANVNGEVGPLCQLYDGRCFFVGGKGQNFLYDLGGNSWTSAGLSPLDEGGVPLCGNDSPAAVMPTGDLLVGLGPQPPAGGGYPSGLQLFVWHPGSGNWDDVAPPAPKWADLQSFTVSMLTLPSGQVLVVSQQLGLALFNADGSPQEAWRPKVKSVTSVGPTAIQVAGTNLCGLTQGAYYGDDWITATNFPVVYATDQSGAVRFCRVTGMTSRSIKPGTAQTVTADLPAGLQVGAQVNFHVVANGINSDTAGFGVGGIGLAPNGTQVRCNYVAWGW